MRTLNLPIAIPPALNQPIRSYPLRQYNEPAVFVLGERQGQKVYTNSGPPGDRGPGMPSGPMSMGYANPQIMLAQQNSAMNEMERRARAERERSGSMAGVSRTLLFSCNSQGLTECLSGLHHRVSMMMMTRQVGGLELAICDNC